MTARRRNPLARFDVQVARELAREYLATSVQPGATIAIKDAQAVADACADFAGSNVEYLVAFALDTRMGLLRRVTVAQGGAAQLAIKPSDLFRELLKIDGCVAFVLAHNHPSGDPEPSADDADLTRRVIDGARLLGLQCCDHVVVTPNPLRFVSFRSRTMTDLAWKW